MEFRIEAAGRQPIYRQIVEQVREAVARGRSRRRSGSLRSASSRARSSSIPTRSPGPIRSWSARHPNTRQGLGVFVAAPRSSSPRKPAKSGCSKSSTVCSPRRSVSASRPTRSPRSSMIASNAFNGLPRNRPHDKKHCRDHAVGWHKIAKAAGPPLLSGALQWPRSPRACPTYGLQRIGGMTTEQT